MVNEKACRVMSVVTGMPNLIKLKTVRRYKIINSSPVTEMNRKLFKNLFG